MAVLKRSQPYSFYLFRVCFIHRWEREIAITETRGAKYHAAVHRRSHDHKFPGISIHLPTSAWSYFSLARMLIPQISTFDITEDDIAQTDIDRWQRLFAIFGVRGCAADPRLA